MKIIVTGGAGLIGSHLCDSLIERGHSVLSIDDLSKGHLGNHHLIEKNSAFRFLKGDVCNAPFMATLNEKADVVVHLAAGKIPRYGGRYETLMTNSDGSHHTFALAARLKAKLVFASTSDVYGKNEKAPLTEEDLMTYPTPEVARWSYALSKLFEEHLGLAFAEKHGIPIVAMRFFATFGARQHRSWWGGPVPVFIDQVLQDKPITLHGDGKQTRAFAYVSDTVRGIVHCIEDARANNQIFNIGYPREVSVLELAQTIHRLIRPNTSPKLELVPYSTFGKYEDVRQRVPDISKIQRLLGFEPQVSLEEGLKRTIAWQRELPPVSESR